MPVLNSLDSTVFTGEVDPAGWFQGYFGFTYVNITTGLTWVPTSESSPNWKLLNPVLATVATSGNYTDLNSLPSLSTVATTGKYSDLKSIPVFSTVASSGNYSDLNGIPSLSSVATSGSYTDLLNKPSIPNAQVNTDWNATTGITAINNKPSLSTVATSGNYGDLNGKPVYATVASSGSYSDLLNKPSIPAAQINSDWNATTGLAVINNKPTLSSVATSGNYGDLIGKPSIPLATKCVVGTTIYNNTFRIYKNATVSAGLATFYLTDDGTSTGNALFTNVFTDSIQLIVNDPLASYQFGWAFSNSNKTLTVTANKLTTANILTGLLGQAQANTAIVKLIIEGN